MPAIAARRSDAAMGCHPSYCGHRKIDIVSPAFQRPPPRHRSSSFRLRPVCLPSDDDCESSGMPVHAFSADRWMRLQPVGCLMSPRRCLHCAAQSVDCNQAPLASSRPRRGAYTMRNRSVAAATRFELLARELEQQIAAGVLRPGDRLPSVRQACATRGVSPSTVFQAYYLLESRGLVRAVPRSGYFVAARADGVLLAEPRTSGPQSGSQPVEINNLVYAILGSARARDIVPFGSAFLSPDLFPLDRLRRALVSSTRRLEPWNRVDDLPPGNLRLKREIAKRYLRQGLAVATDEPPGRRCLHAGVRLHRGPVRTSTAAFVSRVLQASADVGHLRVDFVFACVSRAVPTVEGQRSSGPTPRVFT